MNLGTFSLSLKVNDIETSLSFYKTLGFLIVDGGHLNNEFPDKEDLKWRIIEHESVKLGLFQGMLDGNVLTFNPKDVLSIYDGVKSNDSVSQSEEDVETYGSFTIKDPDGNVIMFDQM